MRYYDVFNGDADGICALHQLRLADPLEARLITGLKRDIALLKNVPAAPGDVITVLDISLDRNREGLLALLERGAFVRYFDHHYAGDIPQHPSLDAVIDDSGEVCTSALMDRHLDGRFRPWAVVGAYGDNLPHVAARLLKTLPYDAAEIETLRELGCSLNYNAYGASEADVLMPPAELYRIVSHYADPLDMAAHEPWFQRLAAERRADLERALDTSPARSTERADAYVLPDEAWSRRVSGTFANRLAISDPQRAHAVLTPVPGGGYSVSVRSPRGGVPSAVDFCRRFAAGGGRVGAAGIDRLEPARLDGFLEEFAQAWHA